MKNIASSSSSESGSEEDWELLQHEKTTLRQNSHDCYKYDEPKKRSLLIRLRSWNWKNILTIATLWVAYLLCNMCYSIVFPFFPDEVA